MLTDRVGIFSLGESHICTGDFPLYTVYIIMLSKYMITQLLLLCTVWSIILIMLI